MTQRLLLVLELLGILFLVPAFVLVWLLARQFFARRSKDQPRLLVLDTSYTLEMVIERQLETAVTCRDLNGFFEHVWSVHPYASVVLGAGRQRSGGIATTELTPNHSIVEGKMGRFSWLEFLPRLNFVLSQLGVFFHLDRLIRVQGIALIRSGDPHLLGLLGWSLSAVNRIPLAIRIGIHFDRAYQATGQPALPKVFPSRRWEKLVERFVLQRAHLVAGANQDYVDFAVSNGVAPARTAIFPYGNLIHPSHFGDPAGRQPPPDMAQIAVPSLLIIGRLEPIKMPDHALRVLANLKDRGLNCSLLYVGDGSMREELESLAKELDVAADVHFMGNRSQEWLAGALVEASVILSPLTGRALTEAALSETPVVAYNLDWQSDLIEHEITGLLVESGDMVGMADAVARLLLDAGLGERLGKNLRQRTLERMDPLRLSQHEADTYKRLLEVSRD